ncbi:MAG: hypothetical protein Q8L24_00300 [bacterium]|nr:hypothetical protein [bacterium]
MRSQKSLFYSLAALLAVLVFMVYYDVIVFYASDLFRPWYYDMIEHFIGGVIVAGLFVYYSYARDIDQFPRKFWIALLTTEACGALVAVFWEFLEFTSNILGHAPQNTLPDTIKDLAIGLSGAITGAIVLLPRVLRKQVL